MYFKKFTQEVNDNNIKILRNNFIQKIKEDLNEYLKNKNFSQIELLKKEKEKIELYVKNYKKSEEKIDYSLPVYKDYFNSHLISQSIAQIKDLLEKMNYKFIDSPIIDDPYNCFDFLNVEKNHPARDEFQSFFIDEKVLRPHTSNVQIIGLKQGLEYFFTVGQVFRRDDDSTHTPAFHQIEIVNTQGNLMDLHKTLKLFLGSFLEIDDLQYKLRLSYFPFTEPSYEVDILLNNKWLEVLGCGMIHEKIYERVEKKSSKGFAIGLGLERLIMIKYNIQDIRTLYGKNI